MEILTAKSYNLQVLFSPPARASLVWPTVTVEILNIMKQHVEKFLLAQMNSLIVASGGKLNKLYDHDRVLVGILADVHFRLIWR